MDSLVLFNKAAELSWRNVPERAYSIYENCLPLAKKADYVARRLPWNDLDSLWIKPSGDQLYVKLAASPLQRDVWWSAFNKLASADCGEEPPAGDWIMFGFRRSRSQEKAAESKFLRNLGEGTGYLPMKNPIPGTPSPMAGMLGGGMLGASLGYGAGWLGERFLPPSWDRKKFRRATATLGGLMGASPGIAMVIDNLLAGRHFNSDALVQPRMKTSAVTRTGYGLNQSLPYLPVDAFQSTLWNDPYISRQLPQSTRAAAAGLAESAWRTGQRSDGGVRLVTPADMARITAGMGSGYLSGAIVGKALGALMGMPQETQNTMKRTGLWAGVVANLIPAVMGR